MRHAIAVSCLLLSPLVLTCSWADERLDDSKTDAPPDRGLTATLNDDGVLITEGDRKVLFYQRRPQSLEGRYRRANYVHPLYDLDGRVLTEDFPSDHRHHRGIFWAWHQVWVGERKIGDAWEAKRFDWDVRSVEVRQSDASSIALQAHTLWKSPELQDAAGHAIPIVDERTLIRVHRGTDSLRQIDFEIALRALLPDVRLGGSEDEKGYGGFSVRVQLPEGLEFRGRNGIVEPRTTAVNAGPWLDLSANDWGLAILTHPSDPRFPQPWILRRQRSMQNAAYPGREPVALEMDRPLVLRYRLVLHRGQLEAAALDRLQSEYAQSTEKGTPSKE